MKKAYESPVMVAEEFVANEYVAACWDVYCRGMSNDKLQDGWELVASWTDSHKAHDLVASGISADNASDLVTPRTMWVHSGWSSWSHTENQYGTGSNSHWGVDVVPTTNKKEPNASM